MEYVFDLTSDPPGQTLKLKLTRGLSDEWRSDDECLSTWITGGVNQESNKLVCISGLNKVMTLNNASWDKDPPANGSAVLDGDAPGCEKNWHWVLTSKH
jgi:hypothetical protein